MHSASARIRTSFSCISIYNSNSQENLRNRRPETLRALFISPTGNEAVTQRQQPPSLKNVQIPCSVFPGFSTLPRLSKSPEICFFSCYQGG
jgi:hypothetical protein